MAPVGEVLVEQGATDLPPLNPLQPSHKHLYTSSPKQHGLKHKESLTGNKSKRRSSQQLPVSTESGSIETSNVKRRASRLGMFGLFARQKAPEFDVTEPRLETQPEDEEEDAGKRTDSENKLASPTPQPFIPEPNDEHPQESQQDSLRHRASKRALKTKESFARQKQASWEPPPLFQAYPQSVMHATLNTPTMPAENLIRLSQGRQQKSAAEANTAESSDVAKKHKEKRLRKSHAHELASSREWSVKVFALVTEGYLLQYNGRGSHDRLPEKIMPLCKDSAAFATDAVPGRPYVLQISQTSDEDGTININISKEMLRKANLKNEIKRSASAFLLVLESPEQINAWLVAVRKEIEALGGKEYKAEVFGAEGLEGEEEVDERERPRALQRAPSQRYLVKREPHRFSSRPPEPPPVAADDRSNERGRPQIPKGLGISGTNRYSMATTDSTNSRYISDTTASIDQFHLDQLRESPRHSYVSIDAKTASTSRCSSEERSPVMERSEIVHDAKSERQLHNRLAQTCAVPKQGLPEDFDRDSQQATPTPSSNPSVTTPTIVRVASPPTPNFSVPSFSKRFSVTTSAHQTALESRRLPSLGSQSPGSGLQKSPEDRPKSSSKGSKRMSIVTQSSGRLGTPPRSSDSKDRPRSSESESRFSRRNSSLNYARGISPISLPSHSPSPHPPPLSALPPLPNSPNMSRASLIPPPTGPLPAVPQGAQRTSVLSPLSTSVGHPPKPTDDSPVSIRPPAPRANEDTNRKLLRPVSMQVRPRLPTPSNSHHAILIGATPAGLSLPDGPERQSAVTFKAPEATPPPPPIPPPSPPKTPARKSMPRVGREPPPVPPLTRPLITATPSVEGQRGEVAPHPYIPPIKLSERRSRGSFDGPWNADFGAPKRTFMDLTNW